MRAVRVYRAPQRNSPIFTRAIAANVQLRIHSCLIDTAVVANQPENGARD